MGSPGALAAHAVARTLTLLVRIGLAAACVPKVTLHNAECPCEPGWFCCGVTATCLPEGEPCEVIDGAPRPTADAGDAQSVLKGEPVTLSGRRSAPNHGNSLTYRWAQTTGAPVALSSSTQVEPAFVAPAVSGFLVFELVVNDGFYDSLPAYVTVTVQNRAPLASPAAPGRIVEGRSVRLESAASSDPDGDTITGWLWTQTAGPPVTFDDAATASPSFTAPGGPATLGLSLAVRDAEALWSAPVSITLGVLRDAPPALQPPAASALVLEAFDLLLLGAVHEQLGEPNSFLWSDPNGLPVTFLWTQTAGPPLLLHAERRILMDGPEPIYGGWLTTLMPATGGSATIELRVTNGVLTSAPATVEVTMLAYSGARATAGAAQTAGVHPGAARWVGALDTGPVLGIARGEGTLFLACGDAGLRVVRTIDPTAPELIAAVDSAGSAHAVLVDPNDASVLWVADGTGGLLSFDALAVPPSQLGRFDTPGTATALFIEGRLAYVVDGEAGLLILDVSDPTDIRFVGALDTAAPPNAIAVAGGMVTIATSTGLYGIDVVDPTAPVERDAVTGSNIDAMFSALGYAFVTLPGGLGIFSAPSMQPRREPVALGGLSLAAPIAIGSGQADEWSALFAVATANELAIVDIGDPAAPLQSASLVLPAGTTAIARAHPDNLWVAGTYGVLGLPSYANLVRLEDAYATAAPSATLVYDVSWADFYPSSDEVVACTSSCGICVTSAVDQMAHTARVAWTLPASPAHCELAVVVGNTRYWAAARDRVRVQ